MEWKHKPPVNTGTKKNKEFILLFPEIVNQEVKVTNNSEAWFTGKVIGFTGSYLIFEDLKLYGKHKYIRKMLNIGFIKTITKNVKQ